MKKLTCYICILFFTAALSSASAQSFIEEVLKEPLQNALNENAEVKNQAEKSSKTALERDAVNAKRLPQVSVTGGYGFLYSRLNSQFPTHYLPITQTPIFEDARVSSFHTQALMGGVSVQQVIFTGQQIKHGLNALEEKEKAEKFLAEAGKDEVMKEVIETFDQLMLLNEADKLIEDSEKRLEKEKKKVSKALKNGLAIPYDRDKLKLAMLELDEKKVEADGNRELLYAKLEYLTKMNRESLENIHYELTPFLLKDVAGNAENRKEIKALESGQKAKEFAYKKEKGSHWPTVFAFGNLSYINAFDTHLKLKDVPLSGDVNLKADHLRMQPAAALGVGMKWDLFKGGENKKNIQKAAVDLNITKTELKDTKEKLELLVKKNKSDYKTSEKKVAVVNQQRKVAENNLNMATQQYGSGLIDVTERLASENDFYKVSLNYYKQILKQRATAIELLLSTGTLADKINLNHEN